MKETTRNLLVGLFVASSLVALGALMVVFGEAPSWLGGSEWTLRITGVEQLTGIGDGSSVNLNGVEIGRVKSLEFENPSRPDLGVVIVVGIKKIYSIPVGATAKVYGATLGLGSGRIDIVVEPGSKSDPMDKEFALMRGEMHNIIDEIISKKMVAGVEQTIEHIGALAEAAKPVAQNLAVMIEHRSVADVDRTGEDAARANLTTVLERIDALVANLNAVLGDDQVQEDVKSAVRDLTDATGDLRKTASILREETQAVGERLKTGIDETRGNLDQSFARLTRVLDNLDEASRGMARLMSSIDDGEGTAGRLIRDDRLYEAGVLALDRLSDLIATLQRILGKAEEDGYIKVGQSTPVGLIKFDVPVGDFAARVLEKVAGADTGDPVAAGSGTGQ